MGTRVRLTVDGLDDLHVALDTLLEQVPRAGDVTVTLRVRGEALETELGPFDRAALEAELADDRGIGLRRILDTVVDGVQVRDDDGHAWVVLQKRLAG
jgi:hypothetical protein